MHKVQRLLLTSLILLAAIAPGQASITGAVIDGDGKAIAGARVSMYPPETLDARRLRLQSKTLERVPLASTQSDSKGNFTLESPKEPVVDIRIEAAGFAPDAVRSLADDDLGAVSLLRASIVKGTITSGGKPVAGASVAWSGAAEVMALTDTQGGYAVPDPEKWASRLTVVHPDFAILDENIGPNMPKKGADRTLDGGVAVSGRVLAEDGQTAVGGAVVIVDNWRLATTADDGSFTVAHAMKDWAQVEAQAGERAGVRAHSASSTVSIRLGKAAVVTGSVVDIKSQLPLAGVEVRLNPTGPGLGAMVISSRMTFTDAKGRFTLKPVVPGIYQLAGSRPAGNVSGSSISVNAGQSVSKPLYLTARGRISGSVIDEDKHPIAGARVSFRTPTSDSMMMMIGPRQNGPVAGFSAPDGHFVLRSVATDADLRIDAVRKGFPPGHSGSIRLTPGERKSGVLISIPHGINLAGRVIGHDGKGVSGVSVDAVESSSDGPGGGMLRRMIIARAQERADETIRTGGDGTFITRVKEGTYDVLFKREGFAAKTARGIAVSASSKPLEITLDPGLEVSGRVTRGGAGVEGVNVAVVGADGFTNSVTLPDGSFRIEDLSSGQAMLSVNKPDAFVQLMRPVTIPARDLAIELPQGGRIAGRVIDKSSKHPVTAFQAGVTVSRSGGGMVFMMPPMLKAFTSDDGTFVLDNVPPGPTELVVNAPGYTTGRVPSLNVEDGKTLSDIEVTVDTGVRLTGRVTGPEGSALSGVSVRLDPSAGGGRMRFAGADSSAVTDPNGDYTIDALESGQKTFTFARQGLVSQQKSVDLSGDKVTLNVQLSSGTRVTGVVVSEGGSAVADAMVAASSAADSTFGRQARTDSGGNFQLEGLAGGHYTLSATKSGYANAIQRDVDVTSSAPIRLVLTAGGIISGHVTGLSDKELQQTTVTAQSPTGNASAPVDASGSFRLEGAPVGTVRVSARVGEGIGGLKISAPKSVQIDAGASAQVDLEFKSGTKIRGRVTRNGMPVSNAVVMFLPKGGRSSSVMNGTTDGSGIYEIAGLDDALYNVQVTDMQRLAPYSTSYEVRGSGNFDIDIKSSGVRGRVVDASTGAAIADAHIDIRAAGGDTMMSARGAQTDGGGSFIIDDVARGSYEAVATKEGYGHQTLTLTVADSAEPLEFKLSPGSGITLRVVDLRDQRPIGATAKVTDAQGREVPVGEMFRFAGGTEPLQLTLAPGSYRVTVSAPGYASRTITLNAPSDQTVGLSPGGSLVLQAGGSAPVRARLFDSNGAPYMPGNRGPFGSPIFTIEPKPASTTLQNVAPGRYRLEILDAADQPTRSIDIVVNDGQPSAYEV